VSARRIGLLVALVGAAMALAVAWLSTRESPTVASSVSQSPPDAGARLATASDRRAAIAPRARAAAAVPDGHAMTCAAGAARECDGGDVWSFDSCGRREARVAVCSDRICDRGRCVEPPPGPSCASLRVSETGRCEGEVLKYCQAGIARTVDCAARGQRCGRDELGEPNCVERDARPAAPASPCGACPAGFACVVDGARPRCERRMTLAAVRADPCHGCECSRSEARGPEVCDGIDNDWDGVIDNNVDCPPLEAVAFLVADGDGRTVESEERVREDFRVNRALFVAPPRLVLRDVRVLVRPRWIDATAAVLDRAMRDDPELHRRDEPPFVPVVYTRTITLGAKAVAGVGTLPNGTCARLAPLPALVDDRGFVVLARQRRSTSLAHEIGHYLGLCHTHQRDRELAPSVVVTDEGTVECRECMRTGDGICDTPVDPGLDDGCIADGETCAVSCASGDRPLADNLMSYYPCRESFTDRQVALMRTWWWLRTRR
jgi:hypothetical protein